MHKKLTAWLMSAAMVLSLLAAMPLTASATGPNGTWLEGHSYSDSFAGGDGTVNNPYQIATAPQFARLAYLAQSDDSATSGVYYVQTANIDLSSHDWVPIAYFKGCFDGGNYTISGLAIGSSADYQGLFGICYNATLSNIYISCSILSSGSYSAGLSAAANYVTVTNCHTSGSITGKDVCGGLIGYFNSQYGGNSTITDSSSSCTVTATSGGDAQTGGLIGMTYGGTTEITRCCSTGNVSGFSNVGGILGLGYQIGGYVYVTDSYSTGNIYDTKTYQGYNAGGLLGMAQNHNIIVSSFYQSGTVTCVNSPVGNDTQLGGIIGCDGGHYASFAYTNVYYNASNPTGDTSHTTGTAVPLSVAASSGALDMLDTASGGDGSYDFVKTLNNGGSNWTAAPDSTTNGGFPMLKWQFLPVVSTGAAAGITTTGANLTGSVSVTTGGLSERGISLSTSANFTSGVTKITDSGTNIGTYTNSTPGLQPDTTYYYRAYASNGCGTAYGSVRSFTTAAVTASIAPVLPLTSLTETSLNGAQLTVTLTNATFWGGLLPSQFSLNNAPTGLSVSAVASSEGSASCTLTLAFNGTDFDADYNNFTVQISTDAIQHLGLNITSAALTITAVVESSPSAPTLQSAATNTDGTNVILTFSKAMSDPSANPSQFCISVNGSSNPVTAAALGSDPKTIELTLTTEIRTEYRAAVSYDAASGNVKASDNGVLASLANTAVTNNSTVFPPANAACFTGSNNSYVSIPDSASLNVTSAVTIEAWIKPDGGGEWALIAGKQQSSSDSNPWYSYRLYAGSQNSGEKGFPRKIAFNISTDNGNEVGVYSDTVVQSGVWTHVAGVYDGSALKIYINGVLENTVSHTGNISVSSLPFFIGKAPWTDYNNYNGLMDNLCVWNTARTAAQIADDMTTQAQGTEAGLFGCWHFNQDGGSLTPDATSSRNDGTLYNGVSFTAFLPNPAAPVLQSAMTAADGSKIILTFDKKMAAVQTGTETQYTVSVNSLPNAVTNAARGSDTSSIELTLTTPVTYGQVVTVSYTKGTVAANDDGLLTSFANQPVTNCVPAPDVCRIGSVGYAGLAAALNAAKDKTATITLLEDITYSSDIVVAYGTNITFDLNGHTLNICLDPSTGTYGMNVAGTVNMTGSGAFNVASAGILVHNGGQLSVTNITAASGIAVNASGSGTRVYAKGDISAPGGTGVHVSDGAAVTVDGTISAAVYVTTDTKQKTVSDKTIPTTLSGYNTYAEGTSTVWLKAELPSVTSVSAGTASLTASGGTSLITVTGTNLTNGITVKAFLSDVPTSITGTTAGSGTSQAVSLTFPANTGSSDQAYTIKASINGGTTWDTLTASVTVAKTASGGTGDGGSTTADTGTKVTVSTTDGSSSVTGTLTQTNAGTQIVIKNDAFDKLDSADRPTSVSSQLATITFDEQAMDAIGSASGKTDVTITTRQVQASELSEGIRTLVGSRPVYDFTVTGGSGTISSFGGGFATVSIPYTLQANENPYAVVVWYLSDSGSLVPVRGHYNASTCSVTFMTPHFSRFVVGYNSVSFNDVASGAWYHDAVTFLAARGITTGTTATAFSPDAALTRGQFIVMLMRAYGIGPDVYPADNFSDAGNTYYTDYLAAAKRLGISDGVGDNKFAPEQNISRQEMFTMLYRALKVLGELPAGMSGKTLSDFSDGANVASWAKDALASLLGSGTISGSEGKLSPTDASTRAEMAQVLFNLLGK